MSKINITAEWCVTTRVEANECYQCDKKEGFASIEEAAKYAIERDFSHQGYVRIFEYSEAYHVWNLVKVLTSTEILEVE